MSTRKLTTMGILAALSVILVVLIHFPIFPQAAFLEYDPADIPILVGTFVFGPVAGVIMTLVASIMQGLTVSAGSGLYGIFMHIIATGTYVLVAGNIYRFKKTRLQAGIAIICGALSMGIVMVFANLIITPIFMGVSTSIVKGMILPIILPFNLIKAGANGLITFLIYKPLSPLLHNRKKRKTADS